MVHCLHFLATIDVRGVDVQFYHVVDALHNGEISFVICKYMWWTVAQTFLATVTQFRGPPLQFRKNVF